MSQSNNDLSMSTTNNACIDPLDALIDFSGGDSYEAMSYNNTPSASPASKSTFHHSLGMSSVTQPMPGPSHQYDAYKQQTGFPTGALANTLALNQNTGMYGYGLNSTFDVEDFNDFKPQGGFDTGLQIDAGYGASLTATKPAFYYPEQSYVNPSAMEDSQPMPTAIPSQTNQATRIWPGMHQQQALAKAQAQQKQQQELIQRQSSIASTASARSRNNSKSADPVVEEKISQLLDSMRQSSVVTSEGENSTAANMSHAQRMRKEEEDMDEDERLLASEEGKKLSSKERRQLRNKVSARAFRSRRKEYIGQLEGEIATKVNENADLRSQNRALMEENTRLSDLTRMLLSSSSFSGFLDNLSQSHATPAGSEEQVQPKIEQRQQQQHQRKDVNPYNNAQMHMAMVPEQSVDFSMLDLPNDAYAYQPQVFSVLELPEPRFEASMFNEKSVASVSSEYSSCKTELPILARLPLEMSEPIESMEESDDEEFNNDPAFALFHSSTPSVPCAKSSPLIDFSSVSPPSMSPKSFVVLNITSESTSDSALKKVHRLCSSLDAAMARLESYTIDF